MKFALACTALLLGLGCDAELEHGQPKSSTVAAKRGPIEAHAALTPASPLAGQRLVLEVTVEAAEHVAVTTPLLTVEDGKIGNFNVLEQTSQPDLPLADGRRRWQERLVLDTFATGDVQLPSLHVAFVDNRGTPSIDGFVTLPGIDITVASALRQGETELRPMRTQRPLPIAPISTWWWLTVPAAIALIIALVVWSRRGSAASLVPLTPAERARAALSGLDLNGSEAFARVADIVRRYLEDAFELRAPRATTHEFLREAQHSNVLSKPNRATLHELLQVADLVKFARHMPPSDAPSKAMQTALAFVDDTSVDIQENVPQSDVTGKTRQVPA
jgi:hypothetical protein